MDIHDLVYWVRPFSFFFLWEVSIYTTSSLTPYVPCPLLCTIHLCTALTIVCICLIIVLLCISVTSENRLEKNAAK